MKTTLVMALLGLAGVINAQVVFYPWILYSSTKQTQAGLVIDETERSYSPLRMVRKSTLRYWEQGYLMRDQWDEYGVAYTNGYYWLRSSFRARYKDGLALYENYTEFTNVLTTTTEPWESGIWREKIKPVQGGPNILVENVRRLYLREIADFAPSCPQTNDLMIVNIAVRKFNRGPMFTARRDSLRAGETQVIELRAPRGEMVGWADWDYCLVCDDAPCASPLWPASLNIWVPPPKPLKITATPPGKRSL